MRIKSQKRRVIDSAQSRLLRILWHRFGGVTEVSKIVGVSKQLISAWAYRGHVPLKNVAIMSTKLRVLPECLNYENIIPLKRPHFISWEKALDSLNLTGEEREFVNKGKAPKCTDEQTCSY